MTNAEKILTLLGEKLSSPVELTLYGRAALQLGFEHAPDDYAHSRDVDAVLWLDQAEDLNRTTNFWEAVDAVNSELADQELYISHFFVEDQVILRPDWRENRVQLPGQWGRLRLYRLGNSDMLLSKLMRDDPLDQSDARFIAERGGLSPAAIREIIAAARIPDITEIREQFELASRRLLDSLAR